MGEPKHQCQHVIDHFRGWHCSRNGPIFEEGKWWCRQHSPSAVRARYEATQARVNESIRIGELQAELNVAERKLLDRVVKTGTVDEKLRTEVLKLREQTRKA